jgi:hypothetical protein
VKRTSVGVCRREDVRVKMFSGPSRGMVRARLRKAVKKRRLSRRLVRGGQGWARQEVLVLR